MLNPIGDADWPAEIEHMRDGFAGKLNVYRVMAHHPALLQAWENIRNHVVCHSKLTPQQSEIVILRTGHRHRSSYEWAHHVSRGLSAGLTRERIDAVRTVPDAPEDKLLVTAVDALIDNGKIADPLATELQRALGIPAMLDLIATVGMYTTLAFLIESFNIPIEPEVAQP
ncbi:MAG TPA: carboxymuconolactone decarboxylase family protein [Erythrobacter sp.]|nr:carboxymuconolactone decarboxylase family protein [Erythrobacter sp.]